MSVTHRAMAVLLAGATAGLLAADAPSIVTLVVPDRTNANVSLAADGAYVAAIWSASAASGGTDIYAAHSRDAGRSFSSPVRVNSTPGDARVNGEQPPRIAIVRKGDGGPAMVAVWTTKGDVGTRIVSARSDDEGKTFGPASVVPNGEAAGNRGWENIAVDRHGDVRVLWLDHREMVQPKSSDGDAAQNHAGHDSSPAAKRDGAAMAQMSKLYFATLGDPSSARMLLGGVCYCCKTAIAVGANGDVYAAWRHVYSGNLRDMAFTVSRDGGRTFAAPVRVSEDRWQLDGCPEDGPAIAVDARNQIHVVWPTLVNDTADGRPSIGIFYATSADGPTFTGRERIVTEGVPHHPQIALANNSIVLAWDELKNGARQVVVGRRPFTDAPGSSFTRTVISGSEPDVYPAVVSTGKGALVAWSSTTPARSVIRVAALQ